jgi:hypothetical protein
MQSPWDWVAQEYPSGIRLMFARAVTPERVFETFGADPADVRVLTAAAAHDTVAYPWVRAGRAGDWVFSIDSCLTGPFGIEPLACRLSAGTDLALFDAYASYFAYYTNGSETTSFEPGTSEWRNGSDPDRFTPYMRQAGLNVDPPADDAAPREDPDLALLNMLTLTLGIELPRDQALGPLPTAHVTSLPDA